MVFSATRAVLALARVVKNEWMPAHPNSTLRILSVPCATGEEPYSIAMALMDSGLPATRFRIDAVDVSLRVLDHARRGIYGRNSFRGADLPFRDRYFRQVENGHLLSEIVRERVDFRQGNLLAHDFASHEGLYDYIFCRNVLIYFDGEAQPGSRCGVTETFTGDRRPPSLRDMPRCRLTSRGLPDPNFRGLLPAVNRSTTPSQPEIQGTYATSGTQGTEIRAPPLHGPAGSAALPQLSSANGPVTAGPAMPGKENPDLERASRLADCGKLSEAADMCAAYLHKNPDSAKAHYLLGLIHDASGDEAGSGSAITRKRFTLIITIASRLPSLPSFWKSRATSLEQNGFQPGLVAATGNPPE